MQLVAYVRLFFFVSTVTQKMRAGFNEIYFGWYKEKKFEAVSCMSHALNQNLTIMSKVVVFIWRKNILIVGVIWRIFMCKCITTLSLNRKKYKKTYFYQTCKANNTYKTANILLLVQSALDIIRFIISKARYTSKEIFAVL